MSGSTAVTNDNWQGINPNPSSKSKAELKSDVPFEVMAVSTHTAEKAYEKVLDYVGASYKRDATDDRVINEVRNGLAPVRAYYSVEPLKALPSGVTTRTKAGMIDTQSDVGGWDTYSYDPALVPIDANRDGIPDDWFAANVPAGNTATSKNDEGYTYLEVYLNSLVQDIVTAQNEGAQGTGIKDVTINNNKQAVYFVGESLQTSIDYKRLDIYSINGMLLKSFASGQSGYVTDLNKGIYIVKLYTQDSRLITSKLVK